MALLSPSGRYAIQIDSEIFEAALLSKIVYFTTSAIQSITIVLEPTPSLLEAMRVDHTFPDTGHAS